MTYEKVCKCDQAPFPTFWMGPGDEAVVETCVKYTYSML